MFRFEVIYNSKKSRARVGCIHTPHGTIPTPNFVAVGTNGTVKSLSSDLVDATGLDLLFCNTYHLLLQPGPEVVKKAGGLHKFINRSRPIITDSGGFQVFSLAYGSVASELKSQGKKHASNLVLKITEEGVLFRSYRDGREIFLTPESSVEAQKAFGADIIIPLDELVPYHIAPEALFQSLERTHRWQKRSLETHLAHPQNQAMYGVVHGGMNFDWRKKSLDFVTSEPFDGVAIGGSLGKSKEELKSLIAHLCDHLPHDRPNHLLGIGDIGSLSELIVFGLDTFDSSYPTRAARHGMLLTKAGPIKIERALYACEFAPIEKDCDCTTCQKTTLAYLHHLFKASELTAFTLASTHNLHFMVRRMKEFRQEILDGKI